MNAWPLLNIVHISVRSSFPLHPAGGQLELDWINPDKHKELQRVSAINKPLLKFSFNELNENSSGLRSW